jgi:Fur family ferric uptake transcriptional regulator
MGSREETSWLEAAGDTLRGSGYQGGGARQAVLELFSREDCAVTALEIEDRLRDDRRRVARASVYRALENLQALGLVRRIERAPGTPAGFERIEPSGQHHHHFVCDDCGKLVPFEDAGLERLMRRLENGSDFAVREHEVVLRGSCAGCSN